MVAKLRRTLHSLSAALVLCLGAFGVSAVAPASASTALDIPSAAECRTTPLPEGCITEIKMLGADAFSTSVSPDGTHTTEWSPGAPGAVTKISPPQPLDDVARRQAQSRNNEQPADPPAQDPPDSAADTPSGSAVTRFESPYRQARYNGEPVYRNAQYSVQCVATTRPPDVLYNSSWGHYARAHSSQYCGASASSHGVRVDLRRYNAGYQYLSGGSANGFGGFGVDAYARYNCNHDRSLRYYNQSYFYARIGGAFVQGPSPETVAADHTCPV